MRKSLIALLLLLGVGAFTANLALAMTEVDRSGDDVGLKMLNAQMVQELAARSARLGTSTGNTDTTFIGYTPGPVINAMGGVYSRANNYWSIYAVNGKDGGKRPINGLPDKGTWNFDDARSTNDANFAYWGVKGDSLQGWVPVRNLMNGTGGLVLDDWNRPWWAMDVGNQSCYVGNSANGRSFGVNGVWHVDGGDAVGTGSLPKPQWHAPVGSSAAWMGLRAHGDNVYFDPKGKQNPFNEDVLQYNGITSVNTAGNDKAFPGYGSQMDQMLYRDIDFAGHAGENLTVNFKFKTVMSTGFGTTASTRVGWFDGDPLQVTGQGGGQTAASLNNFISSTQAGNNAPADSFMVYIGSGVEAPNPVVYTDGSSAQLYDAKHRWFDEVLHWDRDPNSNPLNPQPLYYKELASIAGNYPFSTANTAFADTGFTISASALAPYLQKNNKIRLVFRVKTNRGFDDEGTVYTSGGKGAAVVDDVRIQQGANPVVNHGFENVGDIDNDPGTPAFSAWKSTGKPPGVFSHAEALANVLYEDLCGQKGDISRQCNMTGTIVSEGDHDHSEAASGLTDGTMDRERWTGIFSPTVQLVGPYNIGGRNVHGFYALGANGGVGDVDPGEDAYVQYDIFAGIMNPFTKGNLWRFGAQSYPSNTVLTGANAPPGRLGPVYPAWGQIRFPGFIIFNPDPVCVPDFEGLYQNALVRSSNANGIPDSIRIYVGKRQECYRFGVSTGCAPVDGCYWDNICLAYIDGVPAQLSVDIWQWYNDAFPTNESTGFPGNKALFDTTAAMIKTGLNIAQTTNTATRPDIPGDSIVIASSPTTARVDMVFRILPGPGNYQPIGQGHSGLLRKVPSNPATITKNDGSWWDVYRQLPGDFATPNASVLLHNGKAGWDPNVWLSARCDTSELNIFALQGRNVNGGPADPTFWMSTYHESDAKFPLLGINRFRCFVNDPAGVLTSPNIICNGTIPAWAAPYVSDAGITKEYTKILPDGLFTPGTHIEYFFRDQKDTKVPQAVPGGMIPDTNDVSPQIAEGSTDGHRWQEISILPDRWKDSQYQHPVSQLFGAGPSCLLVVDNNDRRGNERVWKGIADSIGLTPALGLGASDGYSTQSGGAGNLDVNDPVHFVRNHLGQAGHRGPWEKYDIKASESLNTNAGSLGSRLATVKASPSPLNSRSSKQGPTPEMLNAYYTVMLYLTGDLNSGILGPFSNKSANDVQIIKGWLEAGSTSAVNRGFWAIGDGFVEDGENTSLAGVNLMATTLRVSAIDYNYNAFSGYHGNVALLRLLPAWQGKGNAKENIQTYGMRNICLWTNDVLSTATPLLTAITSEYDTPSGGAAAPAGMYKAWASNSQWIDIIDGWDIEHLTNPNDNKTTQRNLWFLKIFNNIWSTVCSRLTGSPVTGLDEPSFDDGSAINFVKLGNNPVTTPGSARVLFGLAKADHVQLKVYDVSGRLVRTLADRQFAAGNHTIVWDGVDNSGKLVNRGVFFTQIKYQNSRFQAARKLIVLQ